MPNLPADSISQLGDLPQVVAVLLIAMVAIIGVVWIGARLLLQTEASRREERQARDAFFVRAIQDMRDMDRTIGKQSSEINANALGQLADAIRDNGTATLTLIQGMSEKVDSAMDANTDAIRSSNNLIASLGRDIDELLRRRKEDEHEDKRRR